MKFLALVCIVLTSINVQAQDHLCLSSGSTPGSISFNRDEVNNYLHLEKYKVILFGEQHNSTFDPEIKYHLIMDANATLGTRHIFMETGSATAWMFNQYLQTGDTTFISGIIPHTSIQYRQFWQRLYDHNKTQPADQQLVVHGVDFESTVIFPVIMQQVPKGSVTPASLQPVMDTVQAHLTDKPLRMYSISNGKMTMYDNTAFINTLRYIQEQFSKHKEDAKTYFGNNWHVINDIVLNKSKVMVKAAPRNRTMMANIRRIVREQQVDRFIGFFGGQHTRYSWGSSMANATKRMKAFNAASVLNILEIVYNHPTPTGTYTSGEAEKVKSLNVNCKATILPAKQVPGYKNKADFIVIADAGK